MSRVLGSPEWFLRLSEQDREGGRYETAEALDVQATRCTARAAQRLVGHEPAARFDCVPVARRVSGRMELRHLRYFLAVAETGNVTRAARRCYVAQSALSAQLGRLETELGVALFIRSRRGMRLTAAGETLRPLATRLLADAERIEQQLQSVRGVLAGRLRLGMIQGAPPRLDLVALVSAFHRAHPGVELQVRTGASEELARDVLDGRTDLAVLALRAPDLPATLTVVPLMDDPLVAVLPKDGPASPSQPMSLRQLVDRGPFIHYRRGSGLRRSVDAAFARAGLDVAGAFELDQLADMVRLAAAGVGVTIVPRSVLELPEFEHVAGALLDDATALHTISAVTHGPPSPAARALLAMLIT